MAKTGKQWPVAGYWFGPHFSMFASLQGVSQCLLCGLSP